jgi:soluble lytic murein transglycosylase-like protein
VDWTTTGLNVEAYRERVLLEAANQGLDPALVRAIMHAESAFNPSALSKAGAAGLMQLMPGTASDYGVSNRLDPDQNIRGGVAYLRFLMDMFDGNADLVMAAYNAGQNAVLKYTGIPPYEETQVYVQRVGVLHRRYREEMAKATLSTAQR